MSDKFNSSKQKNDKFSSDKPRSQRSDSDKPRGKKPAGEKSRIETVRGGKPAADKSGADKARSGGRNDKSRTDKPRSEKPRSGKPAGDKPRSTKPRTESLMVKKVSEEEAEDAPKYEKPKNALDDGDGLQSEKLQKVLARAGHGSRREVEAMIQAGRISVDGKISTLGDRVELVAGTKIRLDGHVLSILEAEDTVCRVLAYYKPEGELCTRSDPEGRPTVFDRLPKMRGSRWVAVGRLDVNTSGLLLFTTDGELANRLMHPSREVEREYAVRVFGQIDDEKIKLLSRGVQLEDGPAAFRTIKYQGGEGLNQWYNVTLTEGRNREVRRLWEAVGVQVSRLIRVRYGDLNLPKGLPRGGYKELDLPDINYLRQLVDMTEETVSKLPVERDRRRVKANQIRRAVKRHSQVAPARRSSGPGKR